MVFVQDGSGNWQAVTTGGTELVGQGTNVLFDVGALNADGLDHVQDNAKPGNLNWEDLHGGGDNDYNDVNIGVVWSSNLPVLTTQDAETIGDLTDEASAAFASFFTLVSDAGTDGPGSESLAYSLSVTNSDSGLSSAGLAITLFLIDGKVVGSTAAAIGDVNTENTVFDISVDAGGNVKLTQYAELDHVGENADGDAFNNSANLLGLPEGTIALTAAASVTDADGDAANAAQTLDISSAFNFEDDVPSIDAQTRVELLSESFETFSGTNGWAVVKGDNGTIIGNNGVVWTVNSAGIEIQAGNTGGSTASDGNYHAELDPYSNDGNTTLSTVVELPSSEVTLSFDYKPRPGHVADSDMKVFLGDLEIIIDAQSDGSIAISSPDNVAVEQNPNNNGWTTISLTFSGLAAGSTPLSFVGLGSDDSYGAYLDNINMFADTFGLAVDESDLDTDATANVSSFFEGAFGADGAGDIAYTEPESRCIGSG
ncbi:hypothetical protein LH51_18555 [Nitrincola sp. A-D6]|uniref:DUF5801 repeats-in-toxin domain-containing protein n=1 Tax=Nitrincola sp. A-D6 TaxID=1545442 RepID=UPI00051FD316|nr:DUF5801 repeats-in-toxin domain-containing protein [Nitrincola sp. A-D6]KGK40953.1 hypothetical protein LH51_18555 [Nitrincola sp. A-D6]